MTKDFTICVGTIGTGLWQSPDGGETWRLVYKGLWLESRIFSLAVHPGDSRMVFAGTEDGIYCSQDRGASFERIDSPMNRTPVWKVTFDPVAPNTLFAGTRPAALFRSRDGGQHWQKLTADLAQECPDVRIPRVTSLVVDPTDHNIIWAGIEVDGVRRSLDGGETWSRISEGLPIADIHDIVVSPANPKTVVVGANRELFASTDNGKNWRPLGVSKRFVFPYCRGLALRTDNPQVLFVATGDDAIGSTGGIQRSPDRGQSWELLPLPVEPNTPIWTFATYAADPNRIVASSHYGQLFVTNDGGDSWVKLRREFAEIRSLAWMPN
ncbi:MAG TPA: hypothetical protein VKK81_13435 [Candidatus Binatia bacterium]|nr:hypothetical protein [Candidatus Binatia bacterium]